MTVRRGPRSAERLTAKDAELRRVVRLPDKRTARLVAVFPRKNGRSKGRKARVLLASGAHLSVDLEDLTPLPLGCKVEGCERQGIMVAGWCEACYQAQWKQKQASA